MRKEDLDKIITAALNVANENASVYGSQITKDHKDKIIFRPDSYIKLAAGGSFGGGGAFGSGSGTATTGSPPSSSGTGSGAGTASTAGASGTAGGSTPPFQKLNMAWRQPDRSDVMFEEFFKAVFIAYGADNLKAIGFYKVDDNDGKPIPLEQNDLWGFASKLGPKLRSIKYTVEFGVATVGQGERGGEKIMSLYDLISPESYIDFKMFPLYKDKTVNALLQINAQIRNDVIKNTSTPTMLENLKDFNKNSGWWNTLKDSFKGIQESLITRN
jgi:hypothetical protein